MKVIRIPEAAKRGGISVRVLYERQAAGLWPKAFAVGAQGRRLYEHEVDALNAAFAAGFSDDRVRALVHAIHAERERAGAALAAAWGIE